MTAPEEPAALSLAEGRFARFEAIRWWDLAKMSSARVLVVGAGALGNEVLKNLALLGVGNVVVADMDRIEASNLSRSVLFREQDEGLPKAECAARAACEIYPGMNAVPLAGNVLADVGLGYFRWADVVIGALDNREARVFVNAACARVGRPWLDGGLDVLNGIARGFAPPRTACYECTMGETDWRLLNQRRSCSLLARKAAQGGGAPTTPTSAAVVGAIQAQEAVKILHGMPDEETLLGRAFVFEGRTHNSYTLHHPVNPECGWHEPPPPVHSVAGAFRDTPMSRMMAEAERLLGAPGKALDFGRELVDGLSCPGCGRRKTASGPAEHLREEDVVCGGCGGECVPSFFHSLEAEDPRLGRTARELGLPAWDIVWVRNGRGMVGLEFSGDDPFGKADGGTGKAGKE